MTSTVMIRVDTLDRFSSEHRAVGYALVAVFMDPQGDQVKNTNPYESAVAKRACVWHCRTEGTRAVRWLTISHGLVISCLGLAVTSLRQSAEFYHTNTSLHLTDAFVPRNVFIVDKDYRRVIG